MNILQFAESTEKSGLEFYRELAASSEHEGVRRVFTDLARDEEAQLQRLQRMLDRYPELSGLDSKPLDQQPNIFEQMRTRMNHARPATDLEAYQLAREAEQGIVHDYLAAADLEPDPAGKRLLLWIAALERAELSEIEKLFDFVNAPTDSLEWGEFSNLDEYHNFGRYTDLRQGELGDPVIPDTIRH
jgi:rubrerythrin